MSGPLTEAMAAVRATWTDRWPAPAGVVVLWGENAARALPDASTTPDWLHLTVLFAGKRTVAFGAGAAERELEGRVSVSVFSRRGTGEERGLALLDDALAVFEGRREGGLSFTGDSPFAEPEPSAEGAWWVRQAAVPFTWRYRA